MTRRRRWTVLLCAGALAVGAAAQMPGGAGNKSGPGGGRGGSPPAGADDARQIAPNMVELVNLRLSQLEEDLNLESRQRGQWDRYREAVMQMVDDSRRVGRLSALTDTVTAPKRLDALADIARNRLTAVEEIVEAGKALYTVLNPQQRVVADRRLALPLATLTGTDSGSDLRLRGAPRPAAGGGDAPAGGGPRP